jgi:choline-sulfatase
LFDYYYDRVDIPPYQADVPESIRRFRRDREIEEPLPEERIRVARAAYFGLCEHIDALIGEVLEAVDRTGLSERTVVIYTSDHGESAGVHGCWWKSQYYEESVGVPLIARFPGRIAAGAVSTDICNLIDLGPTIASFGGTELPFRVSGRSLFPIMAGDGTGGWVQETMSELVDPRGGTFKPSRMIRTDEWKLWKYHDPEDLPPALFHLETDSAEAHDLSGDPQCRDVRDHLLMRLYEGWDPERAAALADEKSSAFELQRAWGSIVQPPSTHMLEFPDATYEDDVELL